MEEIQSEEHFDQILAKNKYVLVDIYTNWCGPCKAITPRIVELIPEYKDKVVFVKLNADHLSDITDNLEVRGLPTFLLMKNGKIEERVVGANIAGVKKILDQV